MLSPPRTARGPDIEADVAIEFICAAVLPILGSKPGGRASGSESPPLALYASASASGIFGMALFTRWWLRLPVSVAEADIVAKATMSVRLKAAFI